ncbi:MAG: hypothetical protein Q7J15_08550 [Candidatus Desulfaltia sp.]|nr:hypothetical protein [Candidatus Desulfaltia sp.]
MGHRIAEAIIENGRITYSDHKLPSGKLKVHLVYDTSDASIETERALSLLKETAGIYKGIKADEEARTLRSEWDRNV